MKNKANAVFLAIWTLLAGGCAPFHPVPMNSDPATEAQMRMEQKNADADLEAFIADHPELDRQTKKELRAGTINRREALRRHPRAGEPPATSPR
jgi:hypothetical protein